MSKKLDLYIGAHGSCSAHCFFVPKNVTLYFVTNIDRPAYSSASIIQGWVRKEITQLEYNYLEYKI